MAEQETSTALAPVNNELTLRAKEFNAAGGKNEYAISLPTEGVWQERAIKALCLKNGPMAEQSLGNILCAVLYAEEMGLSAILGDLYFVNGRIATTADAKIRHALGSGLVEGYNVEITKGPKIAIPYSVKGNKTEFNTPNLHAKVTVNVKGWTTPVVYEADLDEWFNGANAAWREHTAFMFRKNCLSKALGEVAPLGVDADEILASNQAPSPDLTAALQSIGLSHSSNVGHPAFQSLTLGEK